jgi:hypothetical protein
MFRTLLAGVVGFGVVYLSVTACMGSDTPSSAGSQMGGPAFNNAGDNGPMVLLTVVVVVVLFAAGILATTMFKDWQQTRAELRRYARGELPRRGVPELNGDLYEYRAPVDYRDHRRIGR